MDLKIYVQKRWKQENKPKAKQQNLHLQTFP